MNGVIRRAPRLRDQVYEALRGMLREGRFPDEPLAEEEIAGRLQVSRTPVREALFQLCREGVLEDTGRGYRMPDLTADDVREIMELRMWIEPQLVRAAVERATKAQIDVIAADVAAEAAAARTVEAEPFIAANAAFRTHFLAMAGNQRIARMLATMDDQVARLRQRTLVAVANREVTLRNHKDFIAALRRRDAARAERALIAVLQAARDYYAIIWNAPRA